MESKTQTWQEMRAADIARARRDATIRHDESDSLRRRLREALDRAAVYDQSGRCRIIDDRAWVLFVEPLLRDRPA